VRVWVCQQCIRAYRSAALQELRQRIKHLAYGHDRATAALKQEGDAAVRATADENARRLVEDYQEKAALRALNREQV